jgi:hypothetical protein
MIEELKKLTEKTSKEHKALVNSAEQLLSKNMENIEKECSPEQVAFIKRSFKDAKSGDLDMEGFMNNIKIFKHGS